MKLNVYGKIVEVERIGFISNWLPGEDPGPGGMQDDVYRSADGQEFVERYITCSWQEYDRKRDGLIWTEEEWNIAQKRAEKENKIWEPPIFNRMQQ